MKIQLYERSELRETKDLEAIYAQLNKDIQLCGYDWSLNPSDSPAQQIKLISGVTHTDADLQALLYRVDLEEFALRNYFQKHSGQFESFAAFILAALLGRAEQKVNLRKKFSQNQ